MYTPVVTLNKLRFLINYPILSLKMDAHLSEGYKLIVIILPIIPSFYRAAAKRHKS